MAPLDGSGVYWVKNISCIPTRLIVIISATNSSRTDSAPLVHVIEDDVSSRRAFVRLMRSAGFESVAYASVHEFLASDFELRRSCIVTDVHMQGLDALDLPKLLRERGMCIPVIFVTADYSDATRDRIRRAGGQAYFQKPVDDQALIDMIQWAAVKEYSGGGSQHPGGK